MRWLLPLLLTAWLTPGSAAAAGAGDPAGSAPASSPPVVVLAPFRDPGGNQVIAFLERRVADDPEDFTAWNRLGGEFLRQLRAGGDLSRLPRAAEAAKRSLAAVPPARNPGGLLLRGRVEQEDHRFRDAVATLRPLTEAVPHQASTWEALGDARLEAGDVPGATEAFHRLETMTVGGVRPEVVVRLARLALLRGDRTTARAGFGEASEQATAVNATETIAFAEVQLGRLDFEAGRWPEAEAHYREALRAVPASTAAFVNLAELAAARGENALAQRLYEELIARVPRPEFCHELADFLIFARRPDEARPWADRALDGYRASVARGEHLYFHHLAAFFSDTRESPDEAVHWARLDAEQRQGPAARDALAWALYRGSHFAEAAAEMDRALGVPDTAPTSHVLGHAGLIFFRAGDLARGAECTRRAYALNPNLDRFHAHR